MTDGKAPHYLVNLYLYCVANLGISHEDNKSLNTGNSIAFTGNVFNFHIILISNSNWCSWLGSAHGRSFLASEQIFTVLCENHKDSSRDWLPRYPTIKSFCSLIFPILSEQKANLFLLEYATCSDMDFLDRYRDIVPDWEAFRAIQSQPLHSSARINTLKIEKGQLIERLNEQSVPFQCLSWYPLGLKLELESPGKLLENLLGHIHIQEELSMVPPLVLDPRPGESVLDMCASPGSKTTQISAMMENTGLVIANEPSLARIAALRSNCERLGAMNVAITRYDGRNFPRGTFDRVLVDAPCSAEGRERRGPGVIERNNCKRSLSLQVLQIGLLRNALRLVRPGGVVVYSTCTYAPEENEMVIKAVLNDPAGAKKADEASLDESSQAGAFARLEKVAIPGLRQCPGIEEWNGLDLGNEMCMAARYYPHINDTGGFFVAKIIKN